MSISKTAASASLIRTINHALILDVVREQGPLSRAEVARLTGLSPATAMRIVNDLIEQEWVVSVGPGTSTGGRPGTLVKFNTSGLTVVSIDIGSTKIYGALTDLGGNIIHETFIRSVKKNRDENILPNLISVIRELLHRPRSSEQKVLGIGIGVPGVTHAGGMVNLAPSLNWFEFPLREILEKEFPLPIYVENDANLAALGEYGYGEVRGIKNMLVIVLGTGIGAGIIIGGALYKGGTQTAGEIGYMVTDRKFLGKPYQGFGALETLASGSGIASRARQMFGSDAAPDLTAMDVFEQARAGDQRSIELVNEVVDGVAMAIVNSVTVLDPEVVILSGGLTESEDLLMTPIREKLKNIIPLHPKLMRSTLSHRATLLGATLYVLTAVTGSNAVRQLP